MRKRGEEGEKNVGGADEAKGKRRKKGRKGNRK